jgi:hypothetical protein
MSLCTTGRYTGGAEVQQRSILNSVLGRDERSMQCHVPEKTHTNHQTGGLGLKERKRWKDGENFIMRSIIIFTVHQSEHREEDGMGGTCSMY